MSSFQAEKAPKAATPAVVDIRDGWKFGFSGADVKKALMEKAHRYEREIAELLSQLEREVGTSAKDFVVMMLAVNSANPNTKACYVKEILTKITTLQADRDRFVRAAKGFSPNMIYILSEQDMELMGL